MSRERERTRQRERARERERERARERAREREREGGREGGREREKTRYQDKTLSLSVRRPRLSVMRPLCVYMEEEEEAMRTHRQWTLECVLLCSFV
jgi:hypothetical protein